MIFLFFLQIKIHELYNAVTLDNDIALLKLSTSLVFFSDNKIAPICLPSDKKDYIGSNAIVTGWGTLASGDFINELRIF